MKKPSKLEMARRMARVSQKELAKKAGVDVTTIYKAERGGALSGYTMLAICRALGKTLDDLFWEEQL